MIPSFITKTTYPKLFPFEETLLVPLHHHPRHLHLHHTALALKPIHVLLQLPYLHLLRLHLPLRERPRRQIPSPDDAGVGGPRATAEGAATVEMTIQLCLLREEDLDHSSNR